MPDYQEVLQVSPNAEQEVIDAAYHRLMDRWWPNRADPEVSAKIAELAYAYVWLGTPEKRATYDQMCRAYEARAAPTGRSAVNGANQVWGTWARRRLRGAGRIRPWSRCAATPTPPSRSTVRFTTTCLGLAIRPPPRVKRIWSQGRPLMARWRPGGAGKVNGVAFPR
jgi:hypothetical protein